LVLAAGALLIAFFAMSFALLIPLIPVVFIAFCIWAIVHASRPSLTPSR